MKDNLFPEIPDRNHREWEVGAGYVGGVDPRHSRVILPSPAAKTPGTCEVHGVDHRRGYKLESLMAAKFFPGRDKRLEKFTPKDVDVAARFVASHSSAANRMHMHSSPCTAERFAFQHALASGDGTAIMDATYDMLRNGVTRSEMHGLIDGVEKQQPTPLLTQQARKLRAFCNTLTDYNSGTPDDDTLVSLLEYKAGRARELDAMREEIDEQFATEQEDTKGDEGDPDINQGDGRWGTLTIVKPDLVSAFYTHIASRRYAPAVVGVSPRHMERWTSDMFVFGRKRTDDGGTVLIDVSGSMSLSDADIERIIEAMPAATIATYSGSRTGGELRIIVRNRRRSRTEQFRNDGMGGNIVDGPALRWLAKQPRPRFWVSDGQATYAYDEFTHNSKDEAAAIAKRGDILRVEPEMMEQENKFRRLVRSHR